MKIIGLSFPEEILGSSQNLLSLSISVISTWNRVSFFKFGEEGK